MLVPSALRNKSLIPLLAGLPFALLVCWFPNWSFATAMALFLVVIVVIPSLAKDKPSSRMPAFFVLLAVSDLAKKATFLAPDQAIWSQYTLLILPYLYYLVFILPQWIASSSGSSLSVIQKLALIYIVLAVLNTWVSPTFAFQPKMAASLLLILPWTMLLIAPSYAHSILKVAQTLTWWGVISTFYGILQFFTGPTLIERNWAQAAADLSIGAGHLAGFLIGEVFSFPLWRINGMQADALTFGLFAMTAFLATILLKCAGRLTYRKFVFITLILGIGIFLSVVRTVWVSFVVFLACYWLIKRFPALFLPGTLFLTFIGMFFIADFMASNVYESYLGFFPNAIAPLMARALTIGTLEARMGAAEALVSLLPDHILYGLGYASSPLIAGKFGTGVDIVSMVSRHNAILEIVSYTGIPGLILFFVLIYRIFSAAASNYRTASHPLRSLMPPIAGYLMGMLVSGFGNGTVFHNFFFFFFAGTVAGMSPSHRSEEELS
jgi:hypothetical protein